MTERLDLPRRYRNQIEALLREHVPGVEVWAYGSRVKGRSHRGSDLDLVLRGPGLKQIPSSQLMDLIEALEESNVPIIVQTHDWARLPERFYREIERKYVVLVGKEEWKIITLRDLGTIITGKTPSTRLESNFGGQIPFVTPRDLDDVRMIYGTERYLTDIGAHTVKNAVIPANAVMVSCIGSDMGKVAIAGKRCVTNQQINSIIINDKFDYKYIYYSLSTRKDELRDQAGGSAVPILNKGHFGDIEIYLPPLPEQRAIAHILGTLDDKIELNRRMNETLEEMARALFKSWFVDFDPVRAKMEGRDTGLPPDVADLFPGRLVESEVGEIPEGWEVVPLPEMIEVNPPRSLRKGEVAPYLDMANMPTKGHVPDTVIDRPFGSGMRFTNGDTLVARITPCLENGKTAYVDFLPHDRIGWGSTEYIVMRPMHPLPNEFAYCLARSAGFREFAIQNMTGTSGRQRVPAQALSQFLLPSPPEPIAARFGKVVQPIFTRASEAVRESRTLAALRDALLPKLVAGELRVDIGERK